MFKIGLGYDIHRIEQLENSTHITLGGLKIPFNKSIIAHSDGDVLIHAIIDAILGALALGDIGQHFPDTSPKYKNCCSKTLLQDTIKLMEKEGYKIGNIDATVIAQKPKLSPHIIDVRESLAQIMNISLNSISVKATTNEQVDATGQEKAIAVHSIALLMKS
jgi:2-C-methyl-D-erythritol 2,4-cyclodiphosphate synthase